MTAGPQWRMWKGHGTENDFLVLPDLDGERELTEALVRRLCDRRAGLGADGILRVVRAGLVPDIPAVDGADFAMDYRNADGTLAEMCGNGLRVFMRYLQRAGLADETTVIATRSGSHRVCGPVDGELTSTMGRPRLLAERPSVSTGTVVAFDCVALEIPNPHVVVPVAGHADLDGLDLTTPPRVDPPLPHGQNVEFVVTVGPRHLRMRVHERGVGETRSCGTGICAAVVATAISQSRGAGDDEGPGGDPWRVDVPGGTCTVTWHPDGEVELRGPAALVAVIDVDEQWLTGR